MHKVRLAMKSSESYPIVGHVLVDEFVYGGKEDLKQGRSNNSKKKKIDPLYQRSIILFHSAIKSEKTRKLYVYHIQKFKEHFIIKNYQILYLHP